MLVLTSHDLDALIEIFKEYCLFKELDIFSSDVANQVYLDDLELAYILDLLSQYTLKLKLLRKISKLFLRGDQLSRFENWLSIQSLSLEDFRAQLIEKRRESNDF